MIFTRLQLLYVQSMHLVQPPRLSRIFACTQNHARARHSRATRRTVAVTQLTELPAAPEFKFCS